MSLLLDTLFEKVDRLFNAVFIIIIALRMFNLTISDEVQGFLPIEIGSKNLIALKNNFNGSGTNCLETIFLIALSHKL